MVIRFFLEETRLELEDVFFPFLPVAKELDIQSCHRVAGPRIGKEVVASAGQLLAHDRRVVDPENHLRLVARSGFGGDQVGSPLVQWCLDHHAAVEVVLARFQVDRPLCHLLTDVLWLVILDHFPAKILDLDLLPVELTGMGEQVLLDIAKQLVDVNLVGCETDFPGITETESELDCLACSL